MRKQLKTTTSKVRIPIMIKEEEGLDRCHYFPETLHTGTKECSQKLILGRIRYTCKRHLNHLRFGDDIVIISEMELEPMLTDLAIASSI